MRFLENILQRRRPHFSRPPVRLLLQILVRETTVHMSSASIAFSIYIHIFFFYYQTVLLVTISRNEQYYIITIIIVNTLINITIVMISLISLFLY